MKQEIINGDNARYLGELERFKDGIPFGIVNKTKTDVGGTYVAANCSSNYIIVGLSDTALPVSPSEHNTRDSDNRNLHLAM